MPRKHRVNSLLSLSRSHHHAMSMEGRKSILVSLITLLLWFSWAVSVQRYRKPLYSGFLNQSSVINTMRYTTHPKTIMVWRKAFAKSMRCNQNLQPSSASWASLIRCHVRHLPPFRLLRKTSYTDYVNIGLLTGLIFAMLADKYGRKWLMLMNVVCMWLKTVWILVVCKLYIGDIVRRTAWNLMAARSLPSNTSNSPRVAPVGIDLLWRWQPHLVLYPFCHGIRRHAGS